MAYPDPAAPPFRAVVMGDADFVSNSFFPYLANSDLILAILRWLVREEHTTAMASRIPVPQLILLSTAQMQQIFLLTEVLLPLQHTPARGLRMVETPMRLHTLTLAGGRPGACRRYLSCPHGQHRQNIRNQTTGQV